MPKDFYERLGVSRNASEQDIKRSYRKLAQKYHPDRNRGDKASETKFKEINEAYEILSDPRKRSQYDQFGTAEGGAGSPNFRGFEGMGFDFGQFAGSGFADIFENFFGGAQRGRAKRGTTAGEDVEIRLEVPFLEAATGTTRDVTMQLFTRCERCNGNAAEPGTPIVTCGTCHGHGEIRTTRATFLGEVMTSRACDRCMGDGRVAEKPCTECRGEGRIKTKKTIPVRIPAGIDDGMTLRLRGLGHAGERGGTAGDLFVQVTVTPHETFSRKGADLFSTVSLDITQLVLGDTITVPTIQGNTTIVVPPGTPVGKVFRLKEYGMPVLRGRSGGRGDHYVTVAVAIPHKLTGDERRLFEELRRVRGQEPSREGFLKKFMK